MPVPGLSLLGLKCIRGFVSILCSINPTITIMEEVYLQFAPERWLGNICLDVIFTLKTGAVEHLDNFNRLAVTGVVGK